LKVKKCIEKNVMFANLVLERNCGTHQSEKIKIGLRTKLFLHQPCMCMCIKYIISYVIRPYLDHYFLFLWDVDVLYCLGKDGVVEVNLKSILLF